MTQMTISQFFKGVKDVNYGRTPYKAQSLLEVVMECCSDLENSWLSNALDTKPLTKISEELDNYAVSHKAAILKAFDDGVGTHRYSRVLSQDLVEAIIKYDEYQDDLAEFISVVAKERRDPQKKVEIQERLEKAHSVDDRFLSELIKADDNLQPRMYPDAVSNLQAFMMLDALICKVKDNFLTLSNITDTFPEEVISLIALYGESVNTFLTTITKSLMGECDRLINFTEYHEPRNPVGYKLF